MLKLIIVFKNNLRSFDPKTMTRDKVILSLTNKTKTENFKQSLFHNNWELSQLYKSVAGCDHQSTHINLRQIF